MRYRPRRRDFPSNVRRGCLLLGLILLLFLTACHRGAVDTTKIYYEDAEAPAFQVQIENGVEKHVPWADVPEANRYILEYDDPPGKKPRVRVPIVRVTMISRDDKGQPAPPEKAYFYEYTEEGQNPTYKRRGVGGSQH